MSTSHDDAPARILILRFSHLGDVVQTLPMVHALARAYPTSTLAFATQTTYAPLLEPLPQLSQVLTFERSGGARAWLDLRRSLLAFAPTWSIDCQGNWKSASAARLSGASRRIGLALEHWREPSARWLATELAPAPTEPVLHAVDRVLNLVEHVTGSAAPEFDLALTPAERKRAEVLLGGVERPLVLHAAKPADIRSWPPERFVGLASALADAGRDVLLLAGPDEAPLRAFFAAIAPHPRITALPDGLNLRTLSALLTIAAERGGRMVGCDSGPSHIAAAVGLPVLLLHGPQDPARTGPYPTTSHEHLTAANDLPCRPCLERACNNPDGPVCMEDLSVNEVQDALLV